jgi:hypothetical protein
MRRFVELCTAYWARVVRVQPRGDAFMAKDMVAAGYAADLHSTVVNMVVFEAYATTVCQHGARMETVEAVL